MPKQSIWWVERMRLRKEFLPHSFGGRGEEKLAGVVNRYSLCTRDIYAEVSGGPEDCCQKRLSRKGTFELGFVE